MEAKYYTPDIEEFHVGFEYEYLIMDNWHPVGYHPSDMAAADKFFDLLNSNKIRVKCLDKKDVESFGFTTRECLMPENRIELFKTTTISKYYLTFFQDSGDTTITKNNFPLFRGKIKNASELKKLMQQLNIE